MFGGSCSTDLSPSTRYRPSALITATPLIPGARLALPRGTYRPVASVLYAMTDAVDRGLPCSSSSRAARYWRGQGPEALNLKLGLGPLRKLADGSNDRHMREE